MPTKTARRQRIFQAVRDYGTATEAIGRNLQSKSAARHADAVFQVFLNELDDLLENSTLKGLPPTLQSANPCLGCVLGSEGKFCDECIRWTRNKNHEDHWKDTP